MGPAASRTEGCFRAPPARPSRAARGASACVSRSRYWPATKRSHDSKARRSHDCSPKCTAVMCSSALKYSEKNYPYQLELPVNVFKRWMKKVIFFAIRIFCSFVCVEPLTATPPSQRNSVLCQQILPVKQAIFPQ